MTKPSQVFFTNLRTNAHVNLPGKLERLVLKAGLDKISFKDQLVALKIHFGEPGCLAFIRPNYVARLVQLLRSWGAKPFLTDCNTLYSGGRANAVDHLRAASDNGFNLLTAGCQAIIADGLKGLSYREIPSGGRYCSMPKIGTAIADADIIISLNHFKGHEMAGFGGALKNLGMGCGAVPGKLEMHSAAKPVIHEDLCRSCGVCVKHCAHDAVHLNDKKKAEINSARCVGCGQCIALCQYGAADLSGYDNGEVLGYRIADYAAAVLAGKPNFHINFIMNVSPECDCWNHNDAAIIPDLGMMASFDPVAVDKACADMVTAAPVLPNSVLSDKHPHEDLCGKEKFGLMHPDTHWLKGLTYAEEIGLGSLAYERIDC